MSGYLPIKSILSDEVSNGHNENDVKNSKMQVSSILLSNKSIIDEIIPPQTTQSFINQSELESIKIDESYLSKIATDLSYLSNLDLLSIKGSNWSILNKLELLMDNNVNMNDLKSRKLLKKLAINELKRRDLLKKKTDANAIAAAQQIIDQQAQKLEKQHKHKQQQQKEQQQQEQKEQQQSDSQSSQQGHKKVRGKGKKTLAAEAAAAAAAASTNNSSTDNALPIKKETDVLDDAGKKKIEFKVVTEDNFKNDEDYVDHEEPKKPKRSKKKASAASAEKPSSTATSKDTATVATTVSTENGEKEEETKKQKNRGKGKRKKAEEPKTLVDEDGVEEPAPKKRATRKIAIKKEVSTEPVVEAQNKADTPEDSPSASANNQTLKLKLTLKNPAKPKISPKEQRAISKQYDNTYVAIWKDLSRKDGPKISRLLQQSTQSKLVNFKKTAILAARESKRWQIKTNKNQKDLTTKARRSMREMFNFWKRNERVERDLRKKHEKELIDKAKKEEEERESKRQAKKLNFLITQTELYSHFIGNKIKTSEIEGNAPAAKLTEFENTDKLHENSKDFNAIDFDAEDDETLRRTAAANAQNALIEAQNKAREFNNVKQVDIDNGEMNFQNPTSLGDITIEQPKLLKCTLKEYQIKGLNWLANLYDQGINGILADEMGLGKTVQSISVLAYLAEVHNIWGPFLVVSPASTLHNWQQEITKFVPEFKVLPYWGNGKDRKVLRKFWDRKNVTYTKDSPFHVLVTSYQLVVADAQYFQRMKWQYMILDEAQAIKSSQSSRWNSLLNFQCRNRLLLTGTPIQNSMQELWALLHFIMPALFDSHDEFSEWFSKDIESHAQSNTQLNEQQLRRLHVILKPFMLRRIKKNVQSELGDKIEIDVYCDLTNRQKKLYQMLKSQISLMDLIDKATSNSDDGTQSLMNLVMQFRKVCNHPDLFERADVKSSFAFSNFAETSSFMRESNNLELIYSCKNEIEVELPKLIYREIVCPNINNDKGSINKINCLFNIYDPVNIRDNFEDENNNNFSWLRFVDKSPQEIKAISSQSLIDRSINEKQYTDINYTKVNRFKYLYGKEYLPSNKLLLINDHNNNNAFVNNSVHLKEIYSIRDKVYQDMYMNVFDLPSTTNALAPPIEVTCSDRSFQYELNDTLFNPKIRQSLMPLPLNQQLELFSKNIPVPSFPKSEMLPEVVNDKVGYSTIRMPSMNRFITESGKLSKLDSLLTELKANDHRVLVYFQMTRMMDLMEEYLTYRQYKYIRLDGSSKLDDRRDLVHDWQTKPEIFVFLLSTRAGGLGINLTAADTVIFYDSDWNPTIDSQAMDRAHRLGQTRQVTVYRLLVRGTIEERMRDRAKQKEHVQQVVMEGKSSSSTSQSVDFQKPSREVAFWLLDDDVAVDVALKEKQQREEKKALKKAIKESNMNNKKLKKVNLEDLYHEGEGNFDDGSGNTPSRPDTPLIRKH